jgi:hypothetical protein
VTLGKAISTALKGASLLIGAGLAVATKGAVEAEAAQGKFMAATGKSREEAKKFVSGMDSLAGSAGTVGMSFEDIAKTGTTVEQQFGTTGQATTDLAGKVLELAKVSGGDATDQANALGDTLSGMGLDASAAGAVIDNLVASNQQFGTSIGDSITALDNMTPALSTLGLTLKDGQGLLNAFEQANVDASTASGDLAKAIKNLKPGQNIDNLVAQVGAIKDPILRAEEATKLFGKAAGPDMAKVIQPGMKSLQDVELQAKDTAGAAGKAADDMLTFTDRIKGWADKALAGARELGQQFGPALSGVGAIAGAIGPILIDGLKKAWGAVKDSPAVQSAAASAFDIAGTATGAAGTIIGNLSGSLIQAVTTSWDQVKKWLMQPGSLTQRAIAAAGAASGAVYGAAVAVTETVGTALNAAWVAMGSPGSSILTAAFGSGSAAGGAWVSGVVLTIGTLGLAAIGKVMGDALSGNGGKDKPGGANVGDIWLAGFNKSITDGAPSTAAAVSQSLGPALAVSGTSAGQQMAAATVGGYTAASGAWAHMGDFTTQTAQQVGASGGEAVVPAWIQAQDAAANANKNSLTLWDIVLQEHRARQAEADEVFRNSARALTGDLAGELQKGAKSVVKDAMDKLLWAINHPMALNKRTAEIEAALNGQALADGLASKNPAIRTVAEQTRFTLIAEWEKINGKPYGQSAGADFKTALGDQLRAAVAAARDAVKDINAYLRSIKSKVVVTFDSRGELVGHGGNPGIPGRASGGSALAGHLYRVNESRMEYFRPDVSGQVIPLGDHAPAALTFAPNIVVHGASDPQATADAIDQRMRRAWSDFVGQARSAASIRPAESF